MKLDARQFGIAAGHVAAVSFIVCGLFFRIAPGSAGRFFDLLMHTDMAALWRTPGWGALLLGAAAWWVLTALCVGGAAVLYNRAVRS